MMRRTVRLSSFCLCALVGMSIVASFSFYTVNEGETGLVLRNGKTLSTVGPGLNWKLPLADKVLTFSNRSNILHITKNHNYTSDLTEFNYDVSVAWHVAPDKIPDIYIRYNDFQSVELALIKPAVTEQVGLVMSYANAIRLYENPAPFISDAAAAIKNAIGAEVTIDSISFDRIILADLDKPYVPAATVGP